MGGLPKMFPILIVAGAASVAAAQGGPAPGQQPPPAAPPAASPQFAIPAPVAPLFLREPWRQTGAFDATTGFQPERGVTAAAVTSPGLELTLYDPAAARVAAYRQDPPTGSVARDWTGPSCIQLAGYNQNPPPRAVVAGQPGDPPNLWTGVCGTPVAATLRDRARYVDLSGPAKIRWVTRVSGFHVVRPVIKLADGTWLIGDYGDGAPSTNSTLFLENEFAIASLRWLRLDIDRVVTRGTWVERPDLSRVDEVGFADLLPGSGHGWGGFINVSTIEVYGRPVPRAAAAGAAAPQPCDRACLRQTLDRYLAALVKHDPAAAPLGPGFRYTENAVTVRPGDGLWQTISGLGSVQRRYVDPVSGQAAFFGLIEEGAGGGGVATLRLKVVGNAITEGELVIGRRSMGVYNPQGLIDDPPPDVPATSGVRVSRDDLRAAAESYFDGVHNKNGTLIRAHPGCPRIENGVMLAGPKSGRNGGPAQLPDCAAGMDRNVNIAAVVNRRFPVVDEEAGAVLGMAVFLRPADARRADGSVLGRNLLTEIFTIDGGRIRTIHAAMHYLDADVPAPGW
jgi:hypothetical protein